MDVRKRVDEITTQTVATVVRDDVAKPTSRDFGQRSTTKLYVPALSVLFSKILCLALDFPPLH